MRAILLTLLLLPLAGCLSDGGDQEFAEFGTDTFQSRGPDGQSVTIIMGQHILVSGSLDSLTYSPRYALDHKVGQVPLAKAPGLPTESGEVIQVPNPEARQYFAKIDRTTSFANSDAYWYDALTNVELARAKADETISFNMTYGTMAPYAIIMANGVPSAVFAVPAVVRHDIAWSYKTSVFPMNPEGQMDWSSAQIDGMADQYVLAFPTAGIMSSSTVFEGSWQPTDGYDVDLQHMHNGAQVDRSAVGSALSPGDVASSTESVTTTVAPGENVVRVGHLDAATCGGCFYDNTGPVPYVVEIQLTFPAGDDLVASLVE